MRKLPGRDGIAPATDNELVLGMLKSELFDRHILLPHAEVSDTVYAAVDRFLVKYRCTRLKLSIHTDSSVESVQDIFREAYCAHYDDECQRLTRYLRTCFKRTIVLVLISVGAYSVYLSLRRSLYDHPFILLAISNLSAFCLWEIGNTNIAARNGRNELKRARCARDAEISFEIRRGRR